MPRMPCTDLNDANEAMGEQLSETSALLQAEKAEVSRLQDRLEKLPGKRGRGRPKGHAGQDTIEEKWDSFTVEARRKALLRHTNDICFALHSVGIVDWLPSAFMLALKQIGMYEHMMNTKVMAEARCELVKDLAEVLSAEWGPRLAVFCRTELSLSYRDYDKLRLSFCKRFDETLGWVKRVWYRCAVTGATVFMPEPLVSTSAWLPQWKKLTAEHGLAVSADGKVAERSFTVAVAEMLQREYHTLVDPSIRKWFCVFGVDGTSISGKRSFAHAMVNIAPCYKRKDAVITEMKGTTLCIGQHKDDNKGLQEMLHAKKHHPGKEGVGVSSLAQEIEALSQSKQVELPDRCVPCDVKGCFDLAAVRGLTATRGKASPLCGCQGKEGRQRLPGDDSGIPAIPPGESLSVWKQAESILKSGCTYASEVMSSASLHEATHVPPRTWDFDTDGPFKCRHCNTVVWKSWDEMKAAKKEYDELERRADDGDKEAKRELDGRRERHAEKHLNRVLFGIIILQADSDFFVIDPLHCLELNVAKTAFKYSYMDKMDDTIREHVTSYMAEIGCYLDLRAKGQRNPEQKWMTGATVDDYVLGKERDPKSKSPGLAVNTQAMCDLVYAPLAAAAAAPAPPPPPKVTAPASRRRRQAPVGGFNAGAAPESEAPTITEEEELDELLECLMGDLPDPRSLTDYLKSRYGNRAANVLDVMKLWECYGEVFSAWRAEWTEDSPEYRAKRALAFLRASMEFSKRLNKVSNYKHQSWYVHYLVWIVPRQIFELGNTWSFSTCAIESREQPQSVPVASAYCADDLRLRACAGGARLKRLGRKVVSWRSLGAAVYNYIDRRTGLAKRRSQRFSSSPALQMMERIAVGETQWRDTESVFARPENLRLQMQMRACKLKCELADEVTVSAAITMLGTIRQKAAEQDQDL